MLSTISASVSCIILDPIDGMGLTTASIDYPNATGETPCEEEFLALDSATVLIWMMAAHVKLTGDVDWVNRWSNLLRDYADYCVNYGLYPVLQRSSMDSVGAATNQTALSVSAAIALNAYGQMTGLENYTQIAKYFVSVIMDVGMDSNHSHFLIHYGDVDESYILMYPLAFDRLLGLETFPYSTDDTMSAWYIRNEREYGLPFSSDVTYTLMEFEMWAAAVSSPEAKDLFINSIHKFLIHQTGATDSVPGPTQWNVTGEVGIGKWSRFSKAKSIVGSVFMPTAVSHSNKTNGIAEAAAQGNYVASIPVRRDRWQFHSDQNAKPSSQSVGGFDLAAPMPQNASQEVNNSFAGVSIEMSSLPAYLGEFSGGAVNLSSKADLPLDRHVQCKRFFSEPGHVSPETGRGQFHDPHWRRFSPNLDIRPRTRPSNRSSLNRLGM